MSDLIDREQALEKLRERHKSAFHWYDDAKERKDEEIMIRAESSIASFAECILTLKDMPSAEKKGKWERSDDPWKAVCSFAPCKTAICSVCKLDTFDRIDYAKKHYKFCPFCGAKMEVTE